MASKGWVPDLAELVEEAEVEHVAEAGEVDDAGEAVVLDVRERDVPLAVPLLARRDVGRREVTLVCEVAVHEPRGVQHPRRGGYVGRRLHHHPQQRRRHEPQRVRHPRQRRRALARRGGRRLRGSHHHQQRPRGRRRGVRQGVLRQQAPVHGGADQVAAPHPASGHRRGSPVGDGRRREAGEEAHDEAEAGMQQRLLPQLRTLLLASPAAVIRGRPHRSYFVPINY
jgi:hypothetical protein